MSPPSVPSPDGPEPPGNGSMFSDIGQLILQGVLFYMNESKPGGQKGKGKDEANPINAQLSWPASILGPNHKTKQKQILDNAACLDPPFRNVVVITAKDPKRDCWVARICGRHGSSSDDSNLRPHGISSREKPSRDEAIADLLRVLEEKLWVKFNGPSSFMRRR